ncbi:YaaC family protein [Actinokineospora iranica]|uniref:YaaC-like Protein n=1 Tax=Actinokineospora iranica TaxID=1271860 RepID=A0A1G6Y8G9_9PSEU|nr:YaaC family protein [Actinokineospora iranica]SDD86719.1 YaaC-like Protein [Actinokineospora iranica]
MYSGSPFGFAVSGMPTHGSLSRAPLDAVWRQIRSFRHNPPGLAVTGERREVFSASLEQAQQLFSAASKVDWASRPLLLFYGLSQAGRAIAAAARSLDEKSYLLRGHGIRQTNLDDRPGLSALEFADTKGGSFVTLARVLNSSTLGDGVTLGKFWQAIPELTHHPLSSSEPGFPPLHLQQHPLAHDSKYISFTVTSEVLHEAVSVDSPEGVEDFLGNYPALRSSSKVDGGVYFNEIPGLFTTVRTWPIPKDRDFSALLARLTIAYRDQKDLFVFPSVAGGNLPLHPLISWWAVLFALSMLARYSPASWVEYLTIDRSADAVSLELAQDLALDICPRLILRAIEVVSL